MRKNLLLSFFYILIGVIIGILVGKYILTTNNKIEEKGILALPSAKYKVIDSSSKSYYGNTLNISKKSMVSAKNQKWQVVSSYNDGTKGVIVFQKNDQKTGNIYNVYQLNKQYKLIHVMGGKQTKSEIILEK